MPDPLIVTLILAALGLAVGLAVAVARARRYGSRCDGCAWATRALTLEAVSTRAQQHAASCTGSTTTYRRD